MKKLSVIVGVSAVALWLVADTVREFFANETIQYFTDEPIRLLYIVVVGILGGLAALAIDRLSLHYRRKVRIFAWGASASTVTVFVGWLAVRLIPMVPQVIGSDSVGWISISLLLFLGLAVLLWFEFYREVKKGRSLDSE